MIHRTYIQRKRKPDTPLRGHPQCKWSRKAEARSKAQREVSYDSHSASRASLIKQRAIPHATEKLLTIEAYPMLQQLDPVNPPSCRHGACVTECDCRAVSSQRVRAGNCGP